MALTLTGAAAAVQDLFDVELPTGGVVPVSLNTLVVAPSGAGKSRIEKVLFSAHRDHDLALVFRYEHVFSQWKKDHEIWSLKRKDLKKRYSKAQEGCQAEIAEKQLREHLQNEPIEPKPAKLIFADSTLPALLEGLSTERSSGVLLSTEGKVIFDGVVSQGLQHLCALWSGEAIAVDRISRANFVVQEARLSTLIMVQPVVLQNVISQRGSIVTAGGYFARFLVLTAPEPESTGFFPGSAALAELEFYRARAASFFELSLHRKETKEQRQTLKMDQYATQAWLSYYSFVQQNKLVGGRYQYAPEHASRLAENAARLAAVMHGFEGAPGELISQQSIDSAIAICDQLSNHYMSALVPPSLEYSRATSLDSFLDRYRAEGARYIVISKLMRVAPRCVRESAALRSAIGWLEANNRVRHFMQGKRHLLDVMPWLPWDSSQAVIPVG